MENTPQSLRRNIPSSSPATPKTASAAPKSAICSSISKQSVFLEEWWLIKADPDSEGRRLGVGGLASIENKGTRMFLSAPIVRRKDTVTLTTYGGETIMLHGILNRSRTLLNGFSHEVCNHFRIGFPYYWDEFSALSFDEEPDHASVAAGFVGSDVYLAPPISNRDIFDDILKHNGVSSPDEAPSTHKKKKAKKEKGGCSNTKVLECTGPLTRSRSKSSII